MGFFFPLSSSVFSTFSAYNHFHFSSTFTVHLLCGTVFSFTPISFNLHNNSMGRVDTTLQMTLLGQRKAKISNAGSLIPEHELLIPPIYLCVCVRHRPTCMYVCMYACFLYNWIAMDDLDSRKATLLKRAPPLIFCQIVQIVKLAHLRLGSAVPLSDDPEYPLSCSVHVL